MPPADLMSAVPGLLMAAFLPGLAAATVIAPRWAMWERAVIAPGLSAAVIGAIGLALRLVHVPFSAASVLPFVFVIGVIAYIRRRSARRESVSEMPARGTAIRFVLAAGLLAGLLSVAGLAYSLRTQPVPPDWDPTEHGALANEIAQSGDVLPAIPVPLAHSSYFRPRMAFEATATVVSELHGPSPARSMMPVILVVVLFLPLSLVMLALECTGSYWIAGLTPLLSLGMEFPGLEVILGRFPLVVDSGLVVAAVVAMARMVRGRNPVANAAMLSAITAAIWMTHGLEAVTVALIGSPLVIELLLRNWSLSSLLRAGAGLVAAGGGAAVVMLLTVAPRVPAVSSGLLAVAYTRSIGVGSAGTPVSAGIISQYFGQADLGIPFGPALLALGVVGAVVRRQLVWAVGSLALVLLVLGDVIYTQYLKAIWLGAIWPWADVDRLLGLAYWVVPMLMATGLIWATELALSTTRGARVWPRLAMGALVVLAAAAHGTTWLLPEAAVAAIAAIGWVAIRFAPSTNRDTSRLRTLAAPSTLAVLAIVAAFSLGFGALHEQRVYEKGILYRQLATDDDLTVMAKMSQSIPRGSLVMTDSTWDAGMWVSGLTNDTLLVPKMYIGGKLSEPLVSALDGACADPAQAERALASFDAIFIGAHRIPDSPAGWNPRCIASLPGVREIAQAGPPGARAHAYQVLR